MMPVHQFAEKSNLDGQSILRKLLKAGFNLSLTSNIFKDVAQ